MFTKENAREMQLRAWRATMERTSPERRSLSARRAALSRWYPIDGSDKERLNCQIRFQARMAKHLELEGDYNGAVRAVMAMWPLELELQAKAMKDVTPTPTETSSSEQIVTQFSAGNPSPNKTKLLN